MCRRLLLSLAMVAAICRPVAAQSSALDLIPADAAIALVIRNPDELRKKGDAFLDETKMNFGIRPTDLLNLATKALGVNQGWDLQRPAGAVLLKPENGPRNIGIDDLALNLYIALPFSDLDKMAANFGFQPGQLKLDTVSNVVKGNSFGNFVLARDKTLYLAMKEDPLKRLRKAKTLAGELSAEQRQSFAKADLLGFASPSSFGSDWTGLIKSLNDELGKVDDSQEKESINQLTKALESMRFALAGVRIEGGIGVNFVTVFSQEKNAAVETFLANLEPKGGAYLKGLPEGKVIAAQAFGGDGAKNAAFARAFVRFLVQSVLESKRLTSADDRPTFLGVFNEVWQQLRGSRFGVYLTSDETKRGLFSAVAILDTDDAAKFLADMRTLAKIADGTVDWTKKSAEPELNPEQWIKDLSSEVFKVRTSANTRLRLAGEPILPQLQKALAKTPDLEGQRRLELLIKQISEGAAQRRKELLAKDTPKYLRPTFAFVSKAETRGGVPVDIVHVKLKDPDPKAAAQMQQLFGPDWDKLRLAVYGKQVVVLLGSETELFETALANLKNGSPGLASSKSIAGLPDSKKATAAFYVSAATIIGLVQPQPARTEPQRLTGFSVAVEGRSLNLELFVPIADIKAIEKEVRK